MSSSLSVSPLLLCACFFDRDGELVGKTGHLRFGDGADGEADAFLQRYHEDMLLFQIVTDHTSTTKPRMTKISRFARNDNTGI